MARTQFQVLIIPYRVASDDKPEYGVTKRADIDAWQFLSGGGENHKHPFKPPDARPTKKVVFHAI